MTAETRRFAKTRTKESVAFVGYWAPLQGDGSPAFREQIGAMIDAEVSMALRLAGEATIRDLREVQAQSRQHWAALGDLFDNMVAVLEEEPGEDARLFLLCRIEKARKVLGLDRTEELP